MSVVFQDMKAIFLTALEKRSPRERRSYLDDVCGADTELRRQVQALLDASELSGVFLDQPLMPPACQPDPAIAESIVERPGVLIGPYKLLKQIGEGGFGVVFMAEQQPPMRRTVALKVLKPGMDTRQVVARFEAERQALALMDHQNIAHVFGGGETPSGRPYFVMELVRGVPIIEFCDQNQLSVRERLALFVNVCLALQHAHQKGIIHRDLKPSNIMVTMHDNVPVAKVIDFGIAKATGQRLTDMTLFTNFAHMMGTPMYMSPEQAQMSGLDVDTRTDIYSLGVLLYELLTGTTPFDQERMRTVGYDELRRIIREEEPPKPSARISTLAQAATTVCEQRKSDPRGLGRLCRGDLDWIVMKCLEKDRNRRYEAANELAKDVQRYLKDESVLACPPSAWYRFRKFARRNNRVLATAALLGIMMLVTGGVLVWQAHERLTRLGEAERKLAVTEQVLGQALAQASKVRSELHAMLEKPGGVQSLLNQPARWEVFLGSAQAELGRAKLLAAGVDGQLAADLSLWLAKLDQELANDSADYGLARRLENIRLKHLEQSLGAEWKHNHPESAQEYADAFAAAGLSALQNSASELATHVAKSAIKEQLLAALDDWALHASRQPEPDERELVGQLLAVARIADPDRWRDQFRDPELWKKRVGIVELTQQAMQDGQTLSHLSPPMLLIVASLLNDEPTMKEVWLRRAHALYPADFWVNFNLAAFLHQQEDTIEAIGFYRAAVAVRPELAVVHTNLGNALHKQKDLRGAFDAYRRALDIDVRFAPAWTHLGIVLRDQKDLSGALDAHKQALAIDPQFATAWNNLGIVLRDLKNPRASADAHRKALAINPQNVLAWSNLGTALRDQNDLAGAVDAYQHALDINPQSAPIWSNLGIVLNDQRDVPGAVSAFKRALAIDPEYAPAWTSLGFALYVQQDLAGAEEACRKAVKIDPHSASAWNNLGNLLHARSNLPEATDAYRQALAITPDYARGWFNLGNILVDQSDRPAAVEAYEKAVGIDPKNAKAWCALGGTRLELGHFQEALVALKTGHELGSASKDWTFPSANWIEDCQRLLALEERLPAALKGEAASAAEQLELADLCLRYKRQYGDAAMLYASAFADSKLAQDVEAGHRYNAARAAALAASAATDPVDTAQLRRQALAWLHADLAAWRERLKSGGITARSRVVQQLVRWQQDHAFAELRGADSLEKLTADERPLWQNLWEEAEGLRRQTTEASDPSIDD